MDELFLDETPLQHIQRERPQEGQARLRGRLAAGGVGKEQVDTLVGKLSGGQKARLSLLLATLDAPHLVILDEPTNHLDIESREALSIALAGYQGAVILVSHDPHLINSIADQLWLVKGGTVAPYNEDMEAYKTMLLQERGGGGAASEAKKKAKGPKQKRLSNSERRKLTQPLQEEVTKCEERIEKLEVMKTTIANRMADPAFYTAESTSKIEELTMKHGEIMQAMEKAETMWENASEALEAAKRR